jgi:hypothetical protein
MQKTMFVVFLGFLIAYAPTMAAAASDATWFCSALIIKSAKKPTPFKFQVRGSELIDFKVEENAFYKKWELRDRDETMTYRIVEDTPKSLVAVHAYPFDKESGSSAVMILIDKASNEFRQIVVSTKETDPSTNYEGTCLQK